MSAPPRGAPGAAPDAQRVEFERWLRRWENYQEHVSQYWQGRWPGGTGGAGGSAPTWAAPGRGKVSKIEEKWCRRYQELIDFKAEHGHTNVPKAYTFRHSTERQEVPLGDWVFQMRHRQRNNILEPSRAQRLLQIGFEFGKPKSGMAKFTAEWDRCHKALAAFRDAHGHVEVPDGYQPSPDVPALDGWMTRQRAKSKLGTLPGHMVAKLEALGIDLRGSGRPFGPESEEEWRANFRTLEEYARAHDGDCDVPTRYMPNLQLGRWAKVQREAYAKDRLPEHRRLRLAQLGFNFHARSTDPWSLRLGELQAYKFKVGNTDVPKNFTLNRGLGEFVRQQKLAYKDKTLSAEKIKVLEDMGFNWSLKRSDSLHLQTRWDKFYNDLVQFNTEHGTLDVPWCGTHAPLAHWMSRQRKNYEKGILRDENRERLQALGFSFENSTTSTPQKEWDGTVVHHETKWDQFFNELVEFKVKHGTLEVPMNGAHEPLARWMMRQRKNQWKGVLGSQNRKRLQALGFDFEVTKKESRTWTENYEILVEFKNQIGHMDVPYKLNPELYAWIRAQKRCKKNGELPQDRLALLNEIEFDFSMKDSDNDVEDATPALSAAALPTLAALGLPGRNFLDPEEWEHMYGQLEEYKKEQGDLVKDPQKNARLGSFVHHMRDYAKRKKLSQDYIDRLNGLGFVWTPAGNRWMAKYEELAKYRAEHGEDLPLPLYTWLTAQRKSRKKGSLSEDKAKLLSKIGIDFTTPIKKRRVAEDDGRWMEKFGELEKYKAEHGNCDVPARTSLYYWLTTQKNRHKKGSLLEDKAQRLFKVGIDFTVKRPTHRKTTVVVKDDNRWMKRYAELEKYKAEHGNCDVPFGNKLYFWLTYQRNAYKNNSLPEDRFKLLLSIGFDVRTCRRVAWESRYKDLVAFKDEHGHCEVPSTHDLYEWISLQRRKYRQGKLQTHRLDLLKEIIFNFAPKDPVQTPGALKSPKLEPIDRDAYLEGMWDKSYQELSDFKTHFGHCNIPITHKELSAWAFSQRMAYKKGRLSDKRVQKLKELGFSLS